MVVVAVVVAVAAVVVVAVPGAVDVVTVVAVAIGAGMAVEQKVCGVAGLGTLRFRRLKVGDKWAEQRGRVDWIDSTGVH